MGPVPGGVSKEVTFGFIAGEGVKFDGRLQKTVVSFQSPGVPFFLSTGVMSAPVGGSSGP